MFKVFKKKVDPDLKRRVLKNNEAVLDVLSKNMPAKCCPFLGGQKCIGQMCEHFMEFTPINPDGEKEAPYWRCLHVQNPILLMQLTNKIEKLGRMLGEKNDKDV